MVQIQSPSHQTGSGRCVLLRRLVGIVAGSFALVLMPTAALADPPNGNAGRITQSFTAAVCGIPVTGEIVSSGMRRTRIVNGFPAFTSTGHFQITWTNSSGQSIRLVSNGAVRDAKITNNGDGTVTYVTAITGVSERLLVPGGRTLSKDVGRIVYTAVFDYNGTPLDTNDDQLISFTITKISGPHPDAQSNYQLFCQIVQQVLG